VAPRTVSATMAGRAERDDPARVEISIGAPGFEPGTSSPPDPGSGWPSVAVSACSTNDATFGGCARRRIRPWVAACSFQRGSKTAPPDDSLEDADNRPRAGGDRAGDHRGPGGHAHRVHRRRTVAGEGRRGVATQPCARPRGSGYLDPCESGCCRTSNRLAGDRTVAA
jgi:hypothetical protein